MLGPRVVDTRQHECLEGYAEPFVLASVAQSLYRISWSCHTSEASPMEEFGWAECR
jgi:hypothetical protein